MYRFCISSDYLIYFGANQLNTFLKTLSTVSSILTVCIMYTPVLYINYHAHFTAQFLAQRVLMLCMKHERGTRQKEEIQEKNGRTNRKLEIVKEKGRGTFKIRRKSGDRLMWFTATAATVELKNFRALQQSVSLLHWGVVWSYNHNATDTAASNR